MAVSAQKKPAANRKRAASGRGANGKRVTSGRGGAGKRAGTSRNAKRTPRAASRNGVKRRRSSPSPARREPVRESEFVTAFDWIVSALSGLCRSYGREIGMAALIILTLCDALTFYGVFTKTPSEGILVGWLSVLFRGLFGYGYLLTVPALLSALLILWRWDDRPTGLPIACALLLPFLFGMLGHLLLPGVTLVKNQGAIEFVRSLWTTGQALASGGVLSGGMAEFCRAFFSQFVALVLLLLVLYRVWSPLRFRGHWEMEERSGYYEDEDDAFSTDDEPDYLDDEPERSRLGWRPLDWLKRPNAQEPPDDSEHPDKAEAAKSKRKKKVNLKKKPLKKMSEHPKPSPPDEPEEDEEPEELPPAEEKQERGKRRKNKENRIREEVRAESEEVRRDISRRETARDSGDYLSPPIALLAKNQSQSQREDRAELFRNAKRLEETLTSFDVNAVSAGDAVRGPSITRYEFKLEQGVKLSKIMNLADDIALSLGSSGVRIAPIQNRKSVVGIEVPNVQKTPVLLRDVVESPEFLRRSSATTFALGKDISGEIVTGCIEELPHILIAGTTGSGKSVCTNSMIISLLYKSAPEQLRFIMIDPKMVELAPYNGIPHLLIPVVTDPRKAAGALQWAVTEMMRRYKAFSENGVKKLSEYQRLTLKKKDLKPLPSVVVVIDELADLMMVAAREVEESIMRVAQMGRAAGMHLVIATQRPSADVITGLMKANIPSRIAFAVASAMESRIILDSAGAEKLVGNGDMLYSPLGGERKRVQGCYVAPEEIEKVVAFVKGERETSYDNDVLATIDAAVSGQDKKNVPVEAQPVEEKMDDLLPAAMDIVFETGQASTSMLQRRLKLGYSRASRLIDQMERYGYVGPFEGSRPRQLLITKETWQELKMRFPLPSD